MSALAAPLWCCPVYATCCSVVHPSKTPGTSVVETMYHGTPFQQSCDHQNCLFLAELWSKWLKYIKKEKKKGKLQWGYFSHFLVSKTSPYWKKYSFHFIERFLRNLTVNSWQNNGASKYVCFVFQGQLSVLTFITLFRYPFHPRVTTLARKRSQSICQKCRWQVTAKHARTLRMRLCIKWCDRVHGCMVYAEHTKITLATCCCWTWHKRQTCTTYPTTEKEFAMLVSWHKTHVVIDALNLVKVGMRQFYGRVILVIRPLSLKEGGGGQINCTLGKTQ